ncbi:oxidoreductase [Sphingomonas sp. TREG-RG-20F-R18-01]|uniref:oxidoreductase n=1 Tax=Sphingomonas sp. TREG-RG-20F-R18-01 TaxID=2914982 RepID=UPI001F586688
MSAPIRVGLIGYGLAGACFHAPLITALDAFALSAVVTSRDAAVAQALPQARVVRDSTDLFEDRAIDLVVIAVPDAQHAPLARAALEAGKHVVIDKPFVTDPADGAALAALAAARGLMLSVFHNRRWDGDFLTVRHVLDSGVLGEIALAELRWDRYRPAIKPGWRERPGAGLLNDLGPHLIDQAIQLFGMPDGVTGDVAMQRADALADDYVEATLHYGSCRVIVSAATLVAAPRPRFALHGRYGSFVKHGIDPQEAVLRGGGGPRDPGYGIDAPADHGMLTFGDGRRQPVPTEPGNWSAFYEGVARAIREDAAPPVAAADALMVMQVIAQIRRSAAQRSP